jgi:hypothetical protein
MLEDEIASCRKTIAGLDGLIAAGDDAARQAGVTLDQVRAMLRFRGTELHVLEARARGQEVSEEVLRTLEREATAAGFVRPASYYQR